MAPTSTSIRLIPPWPTADQWRYANQAMACMLQHDDVKIQALRQLANQIQECINTLERPLTALCRQTCPDCRDSCCVRATVWYDFKDLLVLHLTDEVLPLAQLIHARGARCHYLTFEGCCLPRRQRPFVCTWYICPQQKALLTNVLQHYRDSVYASLCRIKAYRQRLEDGLIEAVCWRLGTNR